MAKWLYLLPGILFATAAVDESRACVRTAGGRGGPERPVRDAGAPVISLSRARPRSDPETRGAARLRKHTAIRPAKAPGGPGRRGTMATEIEVSPSGGDDYRVEVREGRGATTHTVTVTDEHRDRYAPGAGKEDLLRESFRFLLEREPKESILGRFELPAIERYFPEYPDEIGKRVGPGG